MAAVLTATVRTGPAFRPPKPPVNEDTLKSAKIQIERKTFVLALKENPRGRFLRITEDVGGRRDTIIIPAPGLEEFQKAVGRDGEGFGRNAAQG